MPSPPLRTRIVTGVRPSRQTPREVGRQFRSLVAEGMALRPAGTARDDPRALLHGYTPKYHIRLFDTDYYLTNPRVDENIGFFVGYVVPTGVRGPLVAYPRIFYKDVSLVWRVGTHVIETNGEAWIGKGDLQLVIRNGVESCETAEETTNLPLEIQPAFDEAMTRAGRVKRDDDAVGLILRSAPPHRLEPYADFSRPRADARARPGGIINRGRPVASFTRQHDPSSLRFARGYEPDFGQGTIEVTRTVSRFYRGTVRKVRTLSRNGKIQYGFVVTRRQAWIVPPQALTTEISSYGVRTVDVAAEEELFVPGYEYHYFDDTAHPPRMHSQIPPGFAGRPHPDDQYRADASAWLEALPVVRQLRASLRRRRRR